jgi:predicted signal transduction protein with EAL and GGDEF domain
MAEPFDLASETAAVGVSIGIAAIPRPGATDLAVVLQRADTAMYAAKRDGGSAYGWVRTATLS